MVSFLWAMHFAKHQVDEEDLPERAAALMCKRERA
jgi:hypothetical protein